jgi:hypothetical protein
MEARGIYDREVAEEELEQRDAEEEGRFYF